MESDKLIFVEKAILLLKKVLKQMAALAFHRVNTRENLKLKAADAFIECNICVSAKVQV